MPAWKPVIKKRGFGESLESHYQECCVFLCVPSYLLAGFVAHVQLGDVRASLSVLRLFFFLKEVWFGVDFLNYDSGKNWRVLRMGCPVIFREQWLFKISWTAERTKTAWQWKMQSMAETLRSTVELQMSELGFKNVAKIREKEQAFHLCPLKYFVFIFYYVWKI